MNDNFENERNQFFDRLKTKKMGRLRMMNEHNVKNSRTRPSLYTVYLQMMDKAKSGNLKQERYRLMSLSTKAIIMFAYLSSSLFVFLSSSLSVYLSFCQVVYLSVCLLNILPVCFSV